jgi:hypothetical protein
MSQAHFSLLKYPKNKKYFNQKEYFKKKFKKHNLKNHELMVKLKINIDKRVEIG